MHRRPFLATAGTGLAASLAGCSLPVSGSGSEGGERVARWFPAPDALDVDWYTVQYTDVAAVQDAASDDLFAEYDRALGAGSVGLDHMGLHVTDVESVVHWNNFAAFEGIDDTDAAAAQLEDAGYAATEEYEDTQLYTAEVADGEVAVALGESTAVVAGNVWLVDGEPSLVGAKFEVTAPTMVRGVLDARESEDARYTATDDAVATLVEEVGDGDAGSVSPHGGYEGGYDGEVGQGWELAVGSETTDRTAVYVFGADTEPPVDAVETEYSQNATEQNQSGFEVEQSGRIVTVETTLDTSELPPL